MALRRIVVPLVMASIITACDSSTYPQSASTGGSGDTFASAATVNATPSIAFTPAKVKLAVGGTVTFDFGAVGHNVFFDNDPVGAPATIDGVNANTSVQRAFPVAGVYTYYCHIHPGMSGTIVVGSDTAVQSDSSGNGGYYNPLP
jgi:plastocyanin